MRHFADEVWLYFVIGAKKEALDLHRIRSPAAQFRMGEDIQATGYMVQEDV